MSDAEVLRKAAEILRGKAHYADYGKWLTVDGDFCRAVADWLEATARIDSDSCCFDTNAVAAARIVIGEVE